MHSENTKNREDEVKEFDFIDYMIQQISYENNIDEEDFDIEVSVNYTLNFDEESMIAFGECDIFVDDELHQGLLSIHVKTVGIFSYTMSALTEDMRRKYHIESISILNPKWRDTLLKITSLVELPPIELEDLEIDETEVILDNRETLN